MTIVLEFDKIDTEFLKIEAEFIEIEAEFISGEPSECVKTLIPLFGVHPLQTSFFILKNSKKVIIENFIQYFKKNMILTKHGKVPNSFSLDFYLRFRIF